MVIYHLKKAKAWCTLAILSASLLAPMQTKAQRVAVKTNALYTGRPLLPTSELSSGSIATSPSISRQLTTASRSLTSTPVAP